MKKDTMLTYLDQQLTKKISEYDVALDWDRRNHTIEVVFRLFAENIEREQIDDAQGVLSEEEIIEFEDGILFYNPEKSTIVADGYLATIPYEGKKGIQKKVLAGFIDYLKEVLDNGQSDLLDFLANDEQETFELTWFDERFQTAIQAYTQKEDMQYIVYPSY